MKQNVGDESWIGAIATVGDPIGRSGSWLGGADFTYSTSQFRGDKNLRAGLWGLATGRDDITGTDRTAAGFKIDFTNDSLEIGVTGKRIGADFDPSLGFVPRRGVFLYSGNINNRQRTKVAVQQLTHEFEPSLATDLSGRWESYRVFTAPINWRFRSGERLEFNVVPTGDRPNTPFEVADDVVIAPGPYR